MKKFKTIDEEINEWVKNINIDWRRRGNTRLEKKFLKKYYKKKNVTNLNLMMPTTLLNLYHSDDMAKILCHLNIKYSILGYIHGHREYASLFGVGKHQLYLHANGIVREDFIVWTPKFPKELKFKILREMCSDKLRWNINYCEERLPKEESKALKQHYQDEIVYCGLLQDELFKKVRSIKDIENIAIKYWRFVKRQFNKRVKKRAKK